MLQEVDPSRTSKRGSLPGKIFTGGKGRQEGRAGGEGMSQTREETVIWVGLGPPRRPRLATSPPRRGPARPLLRVLGPPSANAFAHCLCSPGRAPSFLLGLARPPSMPAASPPEPGDEEAG